MNTFFKSQCISCSVMSSSFWPRGLYSLPGSSVHGVGCYSLLQGIFPTQVSCIVGGFFYRLGHQGSPGLNVSHEKWKSLCLTLSDPVNYIVHGILQARILEWEGFQGIFPTQVSQIAGRFFTSWATREAPCIINTYLFLAVYM